MSRERWNAATLVDAVRFHADSHPDTPAVIDSKGVSTYRDVLAGIGRYAAWLQCMELQAGARVVAECTQDVKYLLLDLACSVCGLIFVGVERKIAQDRLLQIIEQTDPSLVITLKPMGPLQPAEAIRRNAEECGSEQTNAEMHISALKITDWKTFHAETAAENAGAGFFRIDPDAVAEILFSTGTTGKSKGAMLTNAANAANAQNVIAGVQMEEDAVELMPLPLNHAHGLRTAYAHLYNGSTVLIANGITLPRVVLNMMEQYGANALDLTPSAAEMLLKTCGEKLHAMADRIRYVEIGAAFLPETTKEKLRSCFPTARLYNFYGSSESGRTCALEFSADNGGMGCIGRPVPNAVFAVLDPDGNILAETGKESGCETASVSAGSAERVICDEPGDVRRDTGPERKTDIAQYQGLLASKGPMNMTGYWGEPELTAETLKDGYVLTADLSYIAEDGSIYVLGRADDVINYKGIKIAPEEIEEAAAVCKLVADCACVPLKDEVAGQVPKLFVVPAENTEFSIEAVFDHLKTHIDANRMPRTIEVIDEIPRTYNGKLLRRKLIGK